MMSTETLWNLQLLWTTTQIWGLVYKSDRTANSYLISCQHLEMDKKKLFFHLYNLTILNSWIYVSGLVGENCPIGTSDYKWWGTYGKPLLKLINKIRTRMKCATWYCTLLIIQSMEYIWKTNFLPQRYKQFIRAHFLKQWTIFKTIPSESKNEMQRTY
jgi:hypothetical protein